MGQWENNELSAAQEQVIVGDAGISLIWVHTRIISGYGTANLVYWLDLTQNR